MRLKIGEKLDSKADFVTFGIAPAILIYQYTLIQNIPYPTLSAVIIGLIIYLCVHYRLKRFNNGGHSDYFEGFPSPAGAAIYPDGPPQDRRAVRGRIARGAPSESDSAASPRSSPSRAGTTPARPHPLRLRT